MVATNVHSVLIVEDERIVAEDLQQTLVEMGYDAFAIASSADEALSRASERCPDLVLMDIRIKGQRDGIETASLLRERFDIPVVYLTAHADEATVERAKHTEPYGYVMKPVKEAELRSVIEVSIYKHEMERRLRDRERWFSTTLSSITDAVITVDMTGGISFMNPAAELLTGVTSEQALGRQVREVVRLLDPAQPASPLERVLEHGQGFVMSEAPLQRASLPGRIVSDRTSPLVDDGRQLGAVMVFRDITEQKLHQKQLELADRLASLGTLAGGVAHEVNNPLAVVVANASFVLEELEELQRDGNAGGARLAEAIVAQTDLRAAAWRIAQIVGDLQTFARPAKAEGATNLGQVVASAIQSTVDDLRDRARVVTDVAGLPCVAIDEPRLRQILTNLLTNAAHAIAPGQVDHNTVSISARAGGGQLVIEVRDTGCGMPPEVVKRVFEPFFSTRKVGARSGLGLAMCHGMVTAAGGQLEVESELGVGSTFRLTLPTVIPTAVPRSVTVPIAVVVARLRGRVLAIDDDPMVLRVLERILREHEIVCVDDARLALARLDRGEKFDLIITDMMMPHMTGLELYERLLADHPDEAHRMVFLTGGAVNPVVADFLSVVPNVSLEKPIATESLRAFVQQRLRDRASVASR